MNDLNQRIIAELLAYHGVFGGPLEGAPMIPVVALMLA